MNDRVTAAIVGSGNIGTDLMVKIVQNSDCLSLGAVIGIDPDSEGLALAKQRGVRTFTRGLEGFQSEPEFEGIDLFFDATSAPAHIQHAQLLSSCAKPVIDLTPAAIGPFVVPCVNLGEHADAPSINMVTCGGQATVPIVAAVSQIGRVHYAEIVSSISSRSAGPGTRANIDEFTETTGRALEVVGGAERGKAIIILNPAEPPLIMRNTVFVLTASTDTKAIDQSIVQMVESVQAYVPGYRLKQTVQFEEVAQETTIPGVGSFAGTKVSVYLEVEGAADYLPAYAGNLDVMTSAALRTGEALAKRWRA